MPCLVHKGWTRTAAGLPLMEHSCPRRSSKTDGAWSGITAAPLRFLALAFPLVAGRHDKNKHLFRGDFSHYTPQEIDINSVARPLPACLHYCVVLFGLLFGETARNRVLLMDNLFGYKPPEETNTKIHIPLKTIYCHKQYLHVYDTLTISEFNITRLNSRRRTCYEDNADTDSYPHYMGIDTQYGEAERVFNDLSN